MRRSHFLVVCLALCLPACATAPEPTLSFWYADVAFAPLADAAARLGAPLTADEIRPIEGISETERERAVPGVGVRITKRRARGRLAASHDRRHRSWNWTRRRSRICASDSRPGHAGRSR